jgi:DNA-directed RNA polymerase subunit RPC12/RpoP
MKTISTVEQIIETLIEQKVKGYRCDSCGGKFKAWIYCSYKCEDCGNTAVLKAKDSDDTKERA